MNTRGFWKRFVIVTLVVVAIACGDTTAPDQDSVTPDTVNLLTNPGFESTAFSLPPNWNIRNDAQTHGFATFVWDSLVQHSGKRSVSITIDSLHPQDFLCFSWKQQLPHTLELTTGRYEFGGWLKATSQIRNGGIAATVVGSEGGAFSEIASTPNGVSDWVFARETFRVAGSVNSVVLEAVICNPRNEDTQVWFDDLFLRKLPSY